MADAETVRRTAEFHGHMCPGLAMGIRAAEVALRELGPSAFRSEGPESPAQRGRSGPFGPRADDEEVVAIVETDMCGVDAIQYLLGCTFGKGNLVHRDYGKNAYTLVRRSDGRAVRISEHPGVWGATRADDEGGDDADEAADDDEDNDDEAFNTRQRQRVERILTAPLEDLYDVRHVDVEVPHRARVFESVTCAACGEATMETRIRRLAGEELCPPCFEGQLGGP